MSLEHQPTLSLTLSLDPRDLKTALFCISFLRKGEVLAYVGSIQNLKDLKDETPKTQGGRGLGAGHLILGHRARRGVPTLICHNVFITQFQRAHPHEIVNQLFTIAKYNIKLMVLWES